MGTVKDEIKKALDVFIQPGAVAELRITEAGGERYKETKTGCFDDMEKMAEEAAKLDGKVPAIYFTLNECNPLILARAANRMKKATTTTSDSDIIRRRWFPIDADVIRPAGVSAPDDLHELALAVIDDIMTWLNMKGWPCPVVGDSGNGGHLCYRIDLPADDETKQVLEKVALVLSEKFSDSKIKVDRSVFNAARIWKLYGTMAGKGDDIPGQPHRRAQLMVVPDPIQAVTIEQLREIAALAPAPKKPAQTVNACASGREIDVEEKCAKWGLSIDKVSGWKDGTKYIIKPCPFNPQHLEGVIVKHPSGAVSFTCPHDSCSSNKWEQLRAMFEEKPVRQETRAQPVPRQPAIEIPARRGINERINPERVLQTMKRNVGMQASGERVTLEMPWPVLSSRSNALRPGTVCILAGPVKSGKSLFAMNIVHHLHVQGIPWRYMPLEDDQEQWAWRALAILFGDYRYIEDKQESAWMREEALEKHADLLRPYLLRVAENPRVGVYDKQGKPVVPEVLYPDILEWVEKAVAMSRIVVVDPFAQIDFDARKTYQQHQEFIRRLLAIVTNKNSTVLLVAHVGKRGGDKGLAPMTSDDVQGSVDLTRLAHTTLLLDRHEYRESEVFRTGGMHETVMHNRTAIISAVRNASGLGQRIAIDAPLDKPWFHELGVIDTQETAKKDKARSKKR
jgi:KaiC/GvpD/RAD55 family RecA-like ATPase